jgi:pentatricopeptide repeat protein
MSEKALNLFEQMHVNIDDVIYVIVFNACTQLANERAKKIGKKLLDQILNRSKVDDNVLKSAIHMLTRFDDVKRAEHIFELIKKKDVYTYGFMMKLYNQHNESLKCLKLLKEMKQQGVIPNEIIFILAIGACSQIGILSVCQSVVAQIPSHLYGKQNISNALIDMWASIDCYKYLKS